MWESHKPMSYWMTNASGCVQDVPANSGCVPCPLCFRPVPQKIITSLNFLYWLGSSFSRFFSASTVLIPSWPVWLVLPPNVKRFFDLVFKSLACLFWEHFHHSCVHLVVLDLIITCKKGTYEHTYLLTSQLHYHESTHSLDKHSIET